MPRFAANLGFLFTEREFLDRFEAAARAGFRAVEFANPYEHSPHDMAARLREHGLECILFNLPAGERARGDFGIACRPGREEEFRDGVAQALRYAAALGTRRVNCIAGLAGAGEDAALLERTLLANLRFAAREFKAEGLELAIEPINTRDVPGFFVSRCDAAARLIAAVDEENFGLQCDLYHAAMMGDDAAATLAAQRAIIRHIQFADAPGRGEPGTGTLAFPKLFDTIDALGYEGWVSAEYRPTKRTEDTLGWLPAPS